jgi:type I restriction enzyme S subunit
MKSSGIEWLGEIPVHWILRKISHFCRVVRGGSPRPAGDPRFFGGNYCPWITVGEITKDENKFLEVVSEYLTPEGIKHSRYLPKGTLVLTNSGATLGVPKILRINGCINDGLVAFLNLKKKLF